MLSKIHRLERSKNWMHEFLLKHLIIWLKQTLCLFGYLLSMENGYVLEMEFDIKVQS